MQNTINYNNIEDELPACLEVEFLTEPVNNCVCCERCTNCGRRNDKESSVIPGKTIITDIPVVAEGFFETESFFWQDATGYHNNKDVYYQWRVERVYRLDNGNLEITVEVK
jgi:hypothetical protein